MFYHLALDTSDKSRAWLHWFGNYDRTPMPRLSTRHSLVNIVSLDTTVLPALDAYALPPRLYCPYHTMSDFGIDMHYFQVAENGRLTLLSDNGPYQAWPEKPYAPVRLTAREVTLEEANTTYPKRFVGTQPAIDHDVWWAPPCFRCGQGMRFVLQFQSGVDLGFSVFDGETLYYGWCASCRVLSAECHTY